MQRSRHRNNGLLAQKRSTADLALLRGSARSARELAVVGVDAFTAVSMHLLTDDLVS
jgi:hypothetical protein